ncbi:ecto-ADP-ribosyltransferase 4-like [Lycodopsis pacificus]
MSFHCLHCQMEVPHVGQTHDLDDGVDDDCGSKATAVTDKAIMQKWDTHTNFSQAWSDAEHKAREPAHKYMEKHHSMAIYMYTNSMLQPVEQDLEESTGKRQKDTFEPRSLYLPLSEAVQILKHSQVTCLRTYYRTETLLNLNISEELIRFSTFVLGSDGQSFGRDASCFQVFTCFGADVTYYSALKLNSQVLIPPYEVFKVTETETDTQRCKVISTLKSNLNCVYDRESNKLHPISALPVDGFWLIFAIAVSRLLLSN